ncbi:helix-turn-helix domain-containing protein [Maritimibacter sp. DP07]|uniref:Helix-turn-helix domain-containing protein n=1 Tax=Maritimibacter harenae TaxID=2606218 RepID=A0A845M4S4_9RHOB|nr:helix-turn-helix transcriptional regulator [Maritimibacter harenae]MZR13398.1 helix-turn-helix domain-containing protein [Maritimibacter harenae]
MPDPIDVFIGKRIRKERLNAGLTQVALAERIGVKFQQLQKYESAQNRVSGSRLWRIAQALEVPVSALFPAEQPNEHGPSEIDRPD